MVDLEQQNTVYWSKNTLSMGTNAILDSVTLDNYKTDLIQVFSFS